MLLRGIKLVVIWLVCSLLLMEGGLRAMQYFSSRPAPDAPPPAVDRELSFRGIDCLVYSNLYCYDPALGWWGRLNLTFRNTKYDNYDIPDVKFNHLGMRMVRDVPYERVDGKPRVLMLGDSVTEGLQVGNGEDMSALMEALSGGAVEVLSLAHSGYEPTSYYLSYKEIGSRFKHDVVVMNVLPLNDIFSTHPITYECYENTTEKLKPFLRRPEEAIIGVPILAHDGKTEFHPAYVTGYYDYYDPAKHPAIQPEWVLGKDNYDVGAGVLRKLNVTLGRNSMLWRKFWTSEVGTNLLLQWYGDKNASFNRAERCVSYATPATGPGAIFAPFGPPLNEDWEKAWENTARLVLLTKELAEKNGAKLVVNVLAPPFHQVSYDKARLPGFYKVATVRDDMDFAWPEKFFDKLGKENGFAVVHTRAAFDAYEAKFNLPEPKFSFTIDGHYNPLGHLITATALIEALAKKKLLPPEAMKRAVGMARAADNTPPEELLGRKALSQIKTGAVYRGDSNVAEWAAKRGRM